ncbi:MAG: PH domain-containing protein [Bacteroidia bacterium]|jgi:heme/copper-type cytochrome/quinol oxidase subunit 4|nr:PH domain-containing protein [Bacteroidia bacterium]
MPETEHIHFDERQYHGLNRHSLLRRLLLATFCFVGYYWSENPKPVELEFFRIGEYPGNDRSGDLFFVLGLAVLALSVVLLFVLHMRTQVLAQAVLVDGRWPVKRVRIDLNGIKAVRRVRLRPSFLNRPVYNLFNRGMIRFYTHGNDAVELTTTDNIIYRIGTQRHEELINCIRQRLNEIQAKPAI